MMRSLYKSDLPEILTIEKSVHISPWTEETFKVCFEAGYLGWALEWEKKILGFIIVSQTSDESHILNICVDREYQHQGNGYKLMRYALEYAKKKGVGISYLEVRRSNSRAITLYRKMGFHLIGERKAYYPSVVGHEDALIFAMSLHQFS